MILDRSHDHSRAYRVCCIPYFNSTQVLTTLYSHSGVAGSHNPVRGKHMIYSLTQILEFPINSRSDGQNSTRLHSNPDVMFTCSSRRCSTELCLALYPHPTLWRSPPDRTKRRVPVVELWTLFELSCYMTGHQSLQRRWVVTHDACSRNIEQ